jgi:hypothetical protein
MARHLAKRQAGSLKRADGSVIDAELDMSPETVTVVSSSRDSGAGYAGWSHFFFVVLKPRTIHSR